VICSAAGLEAVHIKQRMKAHSAVQNLFCFSMILSFLIGFTVHIAYFDATAQSFAQHAPQFL
jgi:hypothetical protein